MHPSKNIYELTVNSDYLLSITILCFIIQMFVYEESLSSKFERYSKSLANVIIKMRISNIPPKFLI